MGKIKSAQLFAAPSQNGNNLWDLRVEYEAEFKEEEVSVGSRFREGFEVWEEDDLSADDLVVSSVQGVGTFVATDTKMTRTLKTTLDGELLDTELGAEEVYAIVRLRHLSVAGLPLDTFQSPSTSISP